jgi:ankyrin repeat protein
MNECVQKDDSEVVKALLLAVHGGRDKEVRRLLATGVDVNQADADGLTALMAAAMVGDYMIARMLLEAGADLCTCNKWGMTAHAIARFHGYDTVVALLDDWSAAVESSTEAAPCPRAQRT